MLSRKAVAAIPKNEVITKSTRFSAKGLQAKRSRIGVSQTDFGRLLAVSAQSIYNWESEKARPRAEQIAKLVALRSLGKREVAVRLGRFNETEN